MGSQRFMIGVSEPPRYINVHRGVNIGVVLITGWSAYINELQTWPSRLWSLTPSAQGCSGITHHIGGRESDLSACNWVVLLRYMNLIDVNLNNLFIFCRHFYRSNSCILTFSNTDSSIAKDLVANFYTFFTTLQMKRSDSRNPSYSRSPW